MADSEDIVPAPGDFTSRRERRAAERAAEAASSTETASVAPIVVPEHLVPALEIQPVPVVAKPALELAPTSVPRRAPKAPPARPRSRRRSIARGFLSVGVMAIAAAFVVGVSLPVNVFGSAAPVVASELPEGVDGAVEAKQQLEVSDTIVAAEATVERDGYSGQSFADAEQARYQASGQGFAPGFVPTAGAIRWPFAQSVPLSSGFGYSEEYGGYHTGLDFVPGEGAPVSAIADGVVTWVGWDNTGRGYYAAIQSQVDGHQIVAIYAHLVDGSSPMYPGQLIKVGDLVGLTGDTGWSYGAHLHLGIQYDGEFIDPFVWLTAHATDATTVP